MLGEGQVEVVGEVEGEVCWLDQVAVEHGDVGAGWLHGEREGEDAAVAEGDVRGEFLHGVEPGCGYPGGEAEA